MAEPCSMINKFVINEPTLPLRCEAIKQVQEALEKINPVVAMAAKNESMVPNKQALYLLETKLNAEMVETTYKPVTNRKRFQVKNITIEPEQVTYEETRLSNNQTQIVEIVFHTANKAQKFCRHSFNDESWPREWQQLCVDVKGKTTLNWRQILEDINCTSLYPLLRSIIHKPISEVKERLHEVRRAVEFMMNPAAISRVRRYLQQHGLNVSPANTNVFEPVTEAKAMAARAITITYGEAVKLMGTKLNREQIKRVRELLIQLPQQYPDIVSWHLEAVQFAHLIHRYYAPEDVPLETKKRLWFLQSAGKYNQNNADYLQGVCDADIAADHIHQVGTAFATDFLEFNEACNRREIVVSTP